MKVVFYGTLIHHLQELFLRKVKTTWTVERFLEQDPKEKLAAALAEAEVLISLAWDASFPAAPRLKLIQSPGTGYDGIDLAALPPQVALCNSYGHAEGVAEYTLLAMLLWCIRFEEAERTFRAGSWMFSGRMNGPINQELYGSTVGIVGLGSIGQAVAQRAAAFGMRVLGCNRTLRPEIGSVAKQYTLADIDAMLRESDYVVVAPALAPETLNLIDAARFAAMKPDAVLINVGRGAIVEEQALYEALRAKRIRGATIDAWYAYPSSGAPDVAPSRFPFHDLPNVRMTPHTSAWTTGMVERRWDEIADNLDRFARGEPLKNVVRPAG